MQTTSTTNNRSYYKGALMAILGGVCWGLSGSMGQFMFNDLGMDSRWLVPLRLGFAGVIMLLYSCVKNGAMVLDPWKTRKNAVALIVYGLFGVSACQFFYFLSIQLSSAAIGTILQDFSPVMILCVICLQQRRAPKGSEILAIVLALSGVFLISTHGSLTDMAVTPAALVIGLLSAATLTLYNMTSSSLMAQYPIHLLQGWSFLMGGVAIAILFQWWTIDYTPNILGILGIAFVVLVGNVLAFTFYLIGVQYVGPTKANLYGFAEPITAAIVGVLVLGNSFTLWDLAGFIAIFAMLALISRQ